MLEDISETQDCIALQQMEESRSAAASSVRQHQQWRQQQQQQQQANPSSADALQHLVGHLQEGRGLPPHQQQQQVPQLQQSQVPYPHQQQQQSQVLYGHPLEERGRPPLVPQPPPPVQQAEAVAPARSPVAGGTAAQYTVAEADSDAEEQRPAGLGLVPYVRQQVVHLIYLVTGSSPFFGSGPKGIRPALASCPT